MNCNIVLESKNSSNCTVFLDEYLIKDKVVNNAQMSILVKNKFNRVKSNAFSFMRLSANDINYLINEEILIEVYFDKDIVEYEVNPDLIPYLKEKHEVISNIKDIKEAEKYARDNNYTIKYIRSMNFHYSRLFEIDSE